MFEKDTITRRHEPPADAFILWRRYGACFERRLIMRCRDILYFCRAPSYAPFCPATMPSRLMLPAVRYIFFDAPTADFMPFAQSDAAALFLYRDIGAFAETTQRPPSRSQVPAADARAAASCARIVMVLCFDSTTLFFYIYFLRLLI